MRRLLILSALLFAGCFSGQRYTEGSYLALGAYIPGEGGNLYGVEIVQYLNGARLSTQTNTPCVFSRQFCATNFYLWGMVETHESTKSELKINR